MTNISEKQIINESRHQIIYDENLCKRKIFLKEICKNNPIILNENRPIAIYLDEFGLPIISQKLKELDENKISIFSSEYLNFSIASNLINSLINTFDDQIININNSNFFNYINELIESKEKVSNLKFLKNLLKETQQVYLENYINYSKTGNNKDFINQLNIPFLNINEFINKFKQALNNNSYICLLFNYQKTISLTSTKSINDLIASRINKDISIKLFCKNNEWQTYYSSNGQLIENIHDYEAIYVKKY